MKTFAYFLGAMAPATAACVYADYSGGLAAALFKTASSVEG
jgi:hypothetical protein